MQPDGPSGRARRGWYRCMRRPYAGIGGLASDHRAPRRQSRGGLEPGLRRLGRVPASADRQVAITGEILGGSDDHPRSAAAPNGQPVGSANRLALTADVPGRRSAVRSSCATASI